MKAKLTKRVVDATQPGTKPVFVWDTELAGFGLKVSPSGRRTYILQYRMGGRGCPTRRYAIGPHGAFTPDMAREVAQDLRVLVAKGIDPAAKRAEERRLAALPPRTFGPLAELYIKRVCPTLVRGSDIESAIRRELLPCWTDRAVDGLRLRDAIALTDALVDAGKPAAALKLQAVIKQVFSWLLRRDEIVGSPVAAWRATDVAPIVRRSRTLTDSELKAVWYAAERYPFGPLVKILMLLGQRRSEVGDMKWAELDLERAQWTIPPERSKNRRGHIVPLPTAAVDILISLPRFNGPYVFSTTDGHRPVAGYSKAKLRLDKNSDVVGWTLHDLRRSVRTGLAALGIADIVAERVLNHQPDVLAQTYVQYEYLAEKADALNRWASHVNDIVSPPPENVIRIAGGVIFGSN